MVPGRPLTSGACAIALALSTCNTGRMTPRWYEVMPTERDTLAVKGYAEWLGKLPGQAFATFTFAWRVSDAQADKNFMAKAGRNPGLRCTPR